MAESIEERLRREDDIREIESYNELVSQINDLISKIIDQFSIRIPDDYVWCKKS